MWKIKSDGTLAVDEKTDSTVRIVLCSDNLYHVKKKYKTIKTFENIDGAKNYLSALVKDWNLKKSAWKFDNYGNAENLDTGEEFYSVVCPDGITRVYKDSKVINSFRHLDDAVNFIKKKVSELEIDENEK